MGHTGSFWADEHTEALKLHVGAGCSYAGAAAKINGEFGTAYSRNAAIGRANRIGLSSPIKISTGRKPRVYTYKPREKRTSLRIVRSNGNSNSMRVVETVEFGMADLRCTEVVPQHVGLLDLAPHGCRYPFGDSPFTFCNHDQMSGSSYCPSHFFLSRRSEMLPA